MEYASKFEKEEQANYDLVYWQERLEKAKSYRKSCGWEDAAIDANRIRRNDIPLTDIKALPGWKGTVYKDNWLWKGIKWLVAMQTGAEISIEVKGFDYLESESKDLLEEEINLGTHRFKLLDISEDTLYDKYYPGFGCYRGIWDTRRIEPMYQTGTPRFEYVSPLNVYFDPATRTKDMSDMRHMFEVSYYDVDELKRRYPKYKNQIVEAEKDVLNEALGLVEVVTLQYKKIILVEKVFIEDQDTGLAKEFFAEEWDELCTQMTTDPEARAKFDASGTNLSYDEWIYEGMFMPEKVVKKGPVESEEPGVFQAIFIDQLRLTLETPQYVGKDYSYFFMIGYHDPECAYPFGLAHYTKDALNASVALMTILLVTAAKTYKNEKLIQQGSLVNQKTYIEEGYKIGLNPIVDEAWQREHPGQKAVENIPLPEFPAAISMLNEQLVQSQKTMTGAVDAAIGLASYSGESGVKVAQLQMASRIYQKEDFDGFRRGVTKGIEWLKDQIIMFRNYPHKIPGLTDENVMGIVDVATGESNRLDSDQYYIEITIQDNHEVVKQIEKEVADNLNNKGYMSGLDLMRTLDVPNPEKKLEQASAERGEKESLEAIRQFPELQQMISQFVQQAGSPGGLQAQPQ